MKNYFSKSNIVGETAIRNEPMICDLQKEYQQKIKQ